MSRTLFIHIGSHKTGTTTLQRTFMANRDALLETHDVAYLAAPNAEHMHPYMSLDTKRGMVPHGFEFTGLDRMVDMLKATPASTTIVSSENFSFVFEQAQIKTLAKGLKGHFDKITIVAYLRRQDSHMVSHHQECAKPRRVAEELLFGSEPRALPTYTKNLDLYLDYATRLSKWQSAFGKGSVEARVFERSALRDGDIVSDFLGLIGLPSDAVERIEDQNTASGFTRAKVGHLINTTIEIEEVKAYFVNRLPNEGRLLPSRDDAEAFYSHYKVSNGRLNKIFKINDRDEVFDLDFSSYPETASDTWSEEQANEALLSVLGSVQHLLQGIGTHEFRDAAFAAEKAKNKVLARRLMKAAYRLRPAGGKIKQKLRALGVSV